MKPLCQYLPLLGVKGAVSDFFSILHRSIQNKKWKSMYLNVDSFVYLPNFNQESNKTAYNDDSVSFIVHHIQENNDWLEHIEEYRTNRQAFQSLTTSPELDICKLYNSVIIIITQLHHRVKTISSRRSLLTGDKLNKVRRVRHTVMQCSTLTKKILGPAGPQGFIFCHQNKYSGCQTLHLRINGIQ